MTLVESNRIHSLFATATLPSLGSEAREGVKSSTLLRKEITGVADAIELTSRTRQLLLGSALLWHDHFDEAHTIVQAIHSADGSLLHGILHRREPDYGNAKYWFHRVGAHPSFPALAAAVSNLMGNNPVAIRFKLVVGGAWQPMAFIDACESVAERGDQATAIDFLKKVQRAEFAAFMDYLCQDSDAI